MGLPRWYLPDGCTAPRHLPHGRIAVTGGPDGGNGFAVGAPYRPGEPGWTKTSDGYWINFTHAKPSDFLRLDVLPGIEVPGLDDHLYLVPTLLRPAAGGFVSMVPRVLGPNGWEDPNRVGPLQETLRRHIGDKTRQPTDQECIDMVMGVLAVNYTFTLADLTAARWITESMGSNIIGATVLLPQDLGLSDHG